MKMKDIMFGDWEYGSDVSRWYGQVLSKDQNGWVKRCMDYVMVCFKPRGVSEKLWKKVVDKDLRSFANLLTHYEHDT